jgi:hypothetical protein
VIRISPATLGARTCDCGGVKASDYCIVVEGELGPRYAAAFDSMQLDAHDGITEITGRIEDEAELRGLLDEVSELGLSLVSVTPVGARAHK